MEALQKKIFSFDSIICNYIKNFKRREKPLAIVFDIDDTIIFLKSGKVNDKAKIVYDCALKNNIQVFFITARSVKRTLSTQIELKEKGFSVYNSLYLMPLNDNFVGKYKEDRRNDILKNYEIILNMGDQWTDLYANCQQCRFIPNDYYIIPDPIVKYNIKLKSLLNPKDVVYQ